MIELKSINVNVDKLPNECPYCHKFIHPKELFKSNIQNSRLLEIVFKCANFECDKLFIGYYYLNGSYYYKNCNTGYFKQIEFKAVINEISPAFVKIYNEAFFSEQNRLLEICGVGYRKAIEFLIKDYLISKYPENEDKIKNKFLGNCIKDDISDFRIKDVAERAVWLGNDETHYVRLWEAKSLQDLKNLIDLIVHWIEYEELTSKMIEEMPEKIK